ncbi:hypothetical protein J5N97_016254 [Dioscorea zingiberensis]|uniref:ACB domain-containing protein n=1 Tax=Dioscorea zingiberensis TaxID=325984 RepID=A0A9D5CJY5_9LILI|nr:hypothetical protein J5N97_016254 [Dioscorea zingiberensis]
MDFIYELLLTALFSVPSRLPRGQDLSAIDGDEPEDERVPPNGMGSRRSSERGDGGVDFEGSEECQEKREGLGMSLVVKLGLWRRLVIRIGSEGWDGSGVEKGGERRGGLEMEVSGKGMSEGVDREVGDRGAQCGLKKPEVEKEVVESERYFAALGQEDESLRTGEVGVDEVARQSEKQMEIKEQSEFRSDKHAEMAMPEEMELEKVYEEERSALDEVGPERLDQPFEGDKEQEKGHECQIGEEVRVEINQVGSLLDDEDEWEGIERSELLERFGEANAYIGSGNGTDAISKLSSDMQMQLYGLHKVATEGPCFEPQPLALKISARSKWHAWQRLGSMNWRWQWKNIWSFFLSRFLNGQEKNHIDSKQDGSKDFEVAEMPVVEPLTKVHLLPYQLSETRSKQEEKTWTEGDAVVDPKVIEPGI